MPNELDVSNWGHLTLEVAIDEASSDREHVLATSSAWAGNKAHILTLPAIGSWLLRRKPSMTYLHAWASRVQGDEAYWSEQWIPSGL